MAFHVPDLTDNARHGLLTALDKQITALDQRKIFEMAHLCDDEQFGPRAGHQHWHCAFKLSVLNVGGHTWSWRLAHGALRASRVGWKQPTFPATCTASAA